MSEHPDQSSLWRAADADTANQNGRSDAAYGKAISALLCRQWIEAEPTDECVDADETQIAKVFAFIARTADTETATAIRAHLLACARCQFIYARLIKLRCNGIGADAGSQPDTTRAEDAVPQLLRTHLRTTGLVVFPGSHPGSQVGQGAWEFGRLRTLPEHLAEEISETVADRAWGLLRAMMPRERIVIVCFSESMHRCGKRLASKMVRARAEDVHVVMADDFHAPKLWCDPGELYERHIVVLVDVVHSGSLLRRLFAICRQGAPRDLLGVAIINQSGTDHHGGDRLVSLWQEEREDRRPYDPRHGRDVRFFDPATAVSYDELPAEVADPERARVTIEHHLAAIAPLLPYIKATGALKQDVQIGGVYYPWAVDLLSLLRDDDARVELASRALRALADLASRGTWCLVYPATKHKRAGAWAELIATMFRWPVLKVGRRSCAHYHQPLTPAQQRALAKWPRALVVDAAIRTGTSLRSLVEVIRTAELPKVKEIGTLYAFDGLFTEQRTELEASLGVEVRSLFKLPFGAPTEPVGRHCRERLKDTLGELNGPKCREHALWADPVRMYCRKKLKRPRRLPKRTSRSGDVEHSVRRAFDEGQRGAPARLEHACNEPSSSLVRNLDVTFALQEPRTRNVLRGFLCNSMPAPFIEWCAMALATQDDYDWFDTDWLLLHRRFFTDAVSSRWLFLACVSYWLRSRGTEEQLQRAQRALESLRRSHAPEQPSLFPEPTPRADPLTARCEALLSVLGTS
jgi:hypothetical protein